MVAYIANTLVSILSGVVIAESVLSSGIIFKTHENSWGYLVLLYVLVLVARAIVVGVLFPFMQYFGYGLDWREAIVLFWSGLRGAVALALSLSVKRSSDNSPYISPDTGDLFVFLTGGIVFLTLIVNGSTTQFILHFLKMDNLSPAKKRILNYTKYEMLKKALESFGDLRDDEELGPADWTTVRRYIKSLNDADGEQIHPHSLSENNNILDSMNLKDIRVRFLNGVQAAYWIMLDEGRINQTTANLLMRSVEKIGLLEKKEMIHLPDAVQTDLKKFLRNPPLVKTPKIKDLISANPLLGALPATAREALAGSTKEIMRLSETTLYKEGSKATGIWLLSNGVVKFLHPTFTHGSTLGLYEVLAEKPYTCDIVTNSVVMCFFIETEKILSVLRSDPAVEDFFWWESTIIHVKIMLPRVFEKMSMQDLQMLIAERSILNVYIRGESFELLPQSVGFLLEGFIRKQGGQEEMLTAPAAILPCPDQSFSQSETLAGAGAGGSYHQVPVYQVETR